MNLFTSIAKVFVGVGIFFSSIFGGHSQIVGTVVPVPYAVFESYLATGITSSATSMTLANGTDNAGNILTGYVCFTVDQGTATQEFICGTASNTSITSLQRGINTLGGTSTVAVLEFSHRRGADVKITDWPILGILSNKVTGVDGFDNRLSYNSHPCTAGSASTSICDKNYTDNVALQGAATSTNLQAGITKLSVAAAVANNPIAVGDNDTRLPASAAVVSYIPTSGQKDALAGASSTPSATNKYLTQAGVATTSVANSIVQTLSTGKIDNSYLSSGFGGDGSDGALTITSGTTTIDLAYNEFVIKNYTSISITGTGALAFSSSTATGTKIMLRSQGDVTLTSSAIPNISVTGFVAGGAGTATNNTAGAVGATSTGKWFQCNGGTGNTTGGAAPTVIIPRSPDYRFSRYYSWYAGAGGGGGQKSSDSGGATTGAGGAGAGVLIIEVGGSLNFTSTLSAAGTAGANGAGASDGVIGGGGGGAGGTLLLIYKNLTANSGTLNVAGGTGGTCNRAGGSGPGGGGGGNEAAGKVGVSVSSSIKCGGDGATGYSLATSTNNYFTF